MKKFLSKNYFSFILLAFFLILPTATQALKLQIDYPEVAGIDLNNVNFDDPAFFSDFLKYLYYFFLSIGGIATFVRIVWGGFKWLTSAGNPSGIGEAKDIIFSAIIGLVLLLSSYLILSTINPSLVIIEIPGLQPPESEASSDVLFYDKPFYQGTLVWYHNSGALVPNTTAGDILSMKIKKNSDAVIFYESALYTDKKMCFNNSEDDLLQYGWKNNNDIRDDVRSLKVVTNAECPTPGVVFLSDQPLTNEIMLYDAGNYRADSIHSWPGGTNLYTQTASIMTYDEDGHIKVKRDNSGLDVLSIALKPGSAVRLWENDDWTGKNICFTNSVPNTLLPEYSFDMDNDIRDDIRSFQMIHPSQCYSPGSVIFGP